MSNQTENYIILKPISERFNKISKAITDDDIKCLIKNELREQLRKVDFAFEINEIISDYIESHQSDITAMYVQGLKERMK